MKRNIFLYPIFLLLLVFLVDKIILWDPILRKGRRESTPLESIKLGMDRIWEQKQNSSNNDKTVVFFGSSRTEGLRFLTKRAILDDSYLDRTSQNNLLRFQYEFRGAAKASELLYHYVLLKGLLTSGYTPEAVFFEISPEMFNRNSPYHASIQFRSNSFPYSELIHLWDFAETDWKKEVASAIAFPSGHYQFSIGSFFSQTITGKDYLTDDMTVNLYSALPSVQDYTGYIGLSETASDSVGGTNSNEGNNNSKPNSLDLKKHSKDFQEKIVGYSHFMRDEFILQNYQFSPSEEKIFLEIVRMAQTAEFPIVFWRPRVHAYYQNILSEVGLDPVDEMVRETLQNNNLAYINLQKQNMRCDFFLDSSHLSPVCAPEAIQILLNHFETSRMGKGIQ